SVVELERDVRGWINEWNKDPKPFVWTKTADETRSSKHSPHTANELTTHDTTGQPHRR
ncbi:hypothetical protein SAMN06265355_1341, partial [Actinomadura mexicana]